MCEVAPRLRHAPPSRAWRHPPPPRTTGPLTSRLPGTPRLPASREGVHRRTTTIALVLVLVVTRHTFLLLLPRFTTPLSTTCGCASGQQRVPRCSKKITERSSCCFDLHDRSRRRRHRYLFCRSWACRSGCRRFPAPAAIAAANLPGAEVHERFIQCDRLRAYDVHLPSAAGQSPVHLRAGSSRSTGCRPGCFTFGHRVWELGFEVYGLTI